MDLLKSQNKKKYFYGKPKKLGHYWCREKIGKNKWGKPFIVKYYSESVLLKDQNYCNSPDFRPLSIIGDDRNFGFKDFKHAQWWGPIEEPPNCENNN